MRIFHGSTVEVKKPAILSSARMLDFGEGFYTTSNREQALIWAEKVAVRRNTKHWVLSSYEFDEEAAKRDLCILRFDQADGKWLDFVCACRSGKSPSMDYDMVIGPVADDNVYATVQFYELGIYDREEAIKRLKVQRLYNQILFHTEKSLRYCRFADALIMEADGRE